MPPRRRGAFFMLRSGGIPPSLRNRSKDTRTAVPRHRPHSPEYRLVRQRSPTPPPQHTHGQSTRPAAARTTGRSLVRLSSHSTRALPNPGALLRQGALPPRPPQGGVAPLTQTFLPASRAGQEGPHSPEYRLVRQRFRSLAKTPRLPVCPLPGKGRARPSRLTTPASENRAQETARPHPCRSTRSAWQRRPSPVRPG